MVVGANGTGKSTILNAICLGLGGEPKLLGRADDARGFIMNGKDNAVMELELAPLPGSETHVLRREIDRNKGSEKGRGRGASTFYINNEHCTIKEVKELVTEHYNIQIDNLCTFLPQDKVGSFSGFDAQQLLLETEKTLSPSQHLYKLHQELIQLESELANGFGDEDDVRDKLKKFEHECAQLEREKDRMQEREKALEQADLLQKKQVWLQFEALRDQALALKGQKSKIKEELKTAQASIQPLEEQAENLAAQKKELEDKFKKLDQTTQRCQQDMAKQKTKFEEHDDKTETIIAEIRELDSKRDNLEENLQRAHDKIDKLKDMEKEFTATPEQVDTELADATEKRRAVHSDYGKAKRDVRDCSDKMQDLESRAGSFQRKLADMNDESARRRERIFRQDPNLGKIHEWVEGNRSVFRHRVWGPIAVEVSTKSQNASAFLEQHVPNWCLKAFVVESKEDYDILWNEIRTKRKIPINIVTVENGRLEQVSRMYSDQKMLILKRDHGVIGYLDDSFTAPDTVMQALRVQASVHKVLVGGEKTQASMDNKGLLDYLTELEGSHGQNSPQNSVTFTSKGQQSFKYTQTLSRYSGKASTRIDDVGPARLLAPGVNERAKKDVEDQLRAVHEEIAAVRPDSQVADKKKNVLEVELQNLSRRVEAAKAMKQNLAHYRSKLETANHKLKDAEAALDVDDDAEKKKLIKTLMSRVAASITALEIQAAQHKKIIQSTISSAGIGVTKSGLPGAERQAR
jgi:chromosome segregation ATPase